MRVPQIAAVTGLSVILLVSMPGAAEAQGRGRGRGRGSAEPATTPSVTAEVVISVGDRERIRAFYADHPVADVEALPPGIRRNLERGKPLPPGIAKRVAPAELRSSISVRDGFQIVQVGLDVLLVEVATNVIHDVLMDVVR